MKFQTLSLRPQKQREQGACVKSKLVVKKFLNPQKMTAVAIMQYTLVALLHHRQAKPVLVLSFAV